MGQGVEVPDGGQPRARSGGYRVVRGQTGAARSRWR